MPGPARVSALCSLKGSCWKLIMTLGQTVLHVCMLSRCSRVQLCVTSWTVAHQAPPSMGFSSKNTEKWVATPFSRALPEPGIELASLMSPPFASWFFTSSATWEAPWIVLKTCFCLCTDCLLNTFKPGLFIRRPESATTAHALLFMWLKLPQVVTISQPLTLHFKLPRGHHRAHLEDPLD